MNLINGKLIRLNLNISYHLIRKISKKSVSVYNTLTKTKEPLDIKYGKNLLWYSCGPTVYDSAHIGHASSYVNFDIVRRILNNHFGVNVTNLMNITDIDDKIIKKASQENKPFTEISRFYEKEFFEDLSLLNCDKPSIVLRVTEHIPEIIQFIQKLIDKGQAYSTESGSVYFRTRQFKIKSFFVLPEEINADAKENEEKEHAFDFVLWKGRKEELEPSWKSPWGMGRPGWHIECSTLANIAFGNNLDFHSGGRDLIFPHHHNEMTQCCAYHESEKWASFWLHTGHLHLSGNEKMSKSLKNTVSIRDLLNKYTSNQFRLFCLLSPYRNDIEFSHERMQKPINLLNSFQSFLKLCKTYCNKEIPMMKLNIDETMVYEKLDQSQRNIHLALCDDFNTCQAIEELSQLMNLINKSFQKTTSQNGSTEDDLNRHYGCVMSVANCVKTTLEMFGLVLDQQSNKGVSESVNVNDLIESSLRFRKNIRKLAMTKEIPKDIKNSIFEACDQLRDDLKSQNIEFKDMKSDTIWQIKE